MEILNIAIPNNNVKAVEGVIYGCFSYTHRLYPTSIALTVTQVMSVVGRVFLLPECCIGLNSKNNPNKSQWRQRVTFKIRLNKVRAMSSLTTRDKHTERLKIKRPRCNGVILRVDSLRVLNKCLSNMLGCKGRGMEKKELSLFRMIPNYSKDLHR